MGKSLSKAELKDKVIKSFQINKNSNVLHQTSDGQCFLEGNKSFATLHANKEKLTVATLNRADFDIPEVEVKAKVKSPVKEKTPTAGEAKPVDYSKMKNDVLMAELIKREITFAEDATKKQLIALLESNDAEVAGKLIAGAEGTTPPPVE